MVSGTVLSPFMNMTTLSGGLFCTRIKSIKPRSHIADAVPRGNMQRRISMQAGDVWLRRNQTRWMRCNRSHRSYMMRSRQPRTEPWETPNATRESMPIC